MLITTDEGRRRSQSWEMLVNWTLLFSPLLRGTKKLNKTKSALLCLLWINWGAGFNSHKILWFCLDWFLKERIKIVASILNFHFNSKWICNFKCVFDRKHWLTLSFRAVYFRPGCAEKRGNVLTSNHVHPAAQKSILWQHDNEVTVTGKVTRSFSGYHRLRITWFR